MELSEALIPAVVLEPDNPLPWHSLSVALSQVGAQEEASLARALSAYLYSKRDGAQGESIGA